MAELSISTWVKFNDYNQAFHTMFSYAYGGDADYLTFVVFHKTGLIKLAIDDNWGGFTVDVSKIQTLI